MEGFYFLCSIIGVGLVIHWVIRNDRIGAGEPTSGLFAMADDRPAPVARNRPPGRRPGERRARSPRA